MNLYLISDMAPVSSKDFLGIQATIECRFTLKLIRDIIITYSENSLESLKIAHIFSNLPLLATTGFKEYYC